MPTRLVRKFCELTTVQGTSKNSGFCVSARKRRTENRSIHRVYEYSSTALTQQSRKKRIFRGALHGTASELLRSRRRWSGLFNFLLVLGVQRLKVDRFQEQRWKPSLTDQIGDNLTGKGKENAGTVTVD